MLMAMVSLEAVDLCPWYGRDKCIELRPWAIYQYTPSIDTAAGNVNHSSNNAFVGINTSVAHDALNIQTEVVCSRTRLRTMSFENVTLCVRNQLSNDCVGDALAITTGLSLIAPSKHALRDYYAMYHGTFEGEAHVAVGKEQICGPYWDTRTWGALVFGLANRGQAWLRGRAAYEVNALDCHQWRLFADASCGFGCEKLFLDVPFKGYGNIQYRTVDLGGSYTWHLNDVGNTLTIGYSMRVFGQNTTRLNQNVMVELLLPFYF
jgi:hypothetical protein